MATTTETRRVDEIVFRDDLYPRQEIDAAKVQQYAGELDVLPPSEVNQHNELIDGCHRWKAHQKEKRDEMSVVVTETRNDGHLLELAVQRNASHGLQLSTDEKRAMARRIYHDTPFKERDAKKAELAKILAVPERTVRDWLSRIDKDTKAANKRLAQDLWLAFWTQQEIADEIGEDQATVSRWLEDFMQSGKLADSHKILASHQETDADGNRQFGVPLYNVWKQQTKSDGLKHFGNTEPNIVDRLVYLYTNPLDGVVDPFAGGGSTIQVCRRRMRRYWVSDRLPTEESAGEGVAPYKRIRQHDLTDGFPKVPRWNEVRLVYLDPPYWKQAEGKYSKDPTDLANMDLDLFHGTLAKIVAGFAKKLAEGYVALIIQPTQWNAPDRQFTDHVGEMLRRVKLPVEMRISCPYESQQCTAQMVEWAKAERQVLVLTREIIVWKA
jgi:ParB-like chromosome segregation protein Spo0J